MPLTTLQVELGDRSYPVHIGSGILTDSGLLQAHIAADTVLVVSNETVAPLYLDRLRQSLDSFSVHTAILPDGEAHKNLRVLEDIFDRMIAVPCDRQTTVLALGGGVVGDIAGFAAACYQRGVPYIQVPTTLLAQVDSSVGGKTAVNHPRGKNMIGAFYQPRQVVIDIDTLSTLDDRQLSAGVAEVIKYGLIRDGDFFDWLEDNVERLLERDPEALSYAIERSCRNKAEVVAADEREQGQRALLNLGHTFGHAIETATGYETWLHGEAVAAGMVMAAELSRRLGDLSSDDVSRVTDLISRARLPIRPPVDLTPDQFMRHMSVDKKAASGVIRLVLLRTIGGAYVSGEYRDSALKATLDHFRAAA